MVNKALDKSLINGAVARKEKSVSGFVPYTHHVDEHTIKTSKGHYVQILKVSGLCAETKDQLDIDIKKRFRATMLRGIASSRFAIYHHIVRREEPVELNSDFINPWCHALDRAYQEKLATSKMFVNEQYITIVRRTAKTPLGMLGGLYRSVMGKADKRLAAETEREDLEAINDAAEMLNGTLKDYGSERLSMRDTEDGRVVSDLLSVFGYFINLDMQETNVTRAPINEYLPRKRVSFGKESYEVRGAASDDVHKGALLSIKDYSAVTQAGMLDNLLRLPHEFILTQSFAFLDRATSMKSMKTLQTQIQTVDEGVGSMLDELDDAIDDVGSGRVSLGEHHLTFNIHAPTAKQLKVAITDAVSVFTDLGITVVREDLNMQAAFWAQLPDNFGYIARRSKITTRNFSCFSSLHTFPSGKRHGNWWGDAITILETTSGTPYAFSFHERDIGNFTLVGPTGAGKTVLLNFMIAQSQRVMPRTFFFDKDRGAEIALRAMGGDYTVVKPGVKTGFNPLQLPDTESNRAFLRDWLETLTTVGTDVKLREDERATIAEAVEANYEAPMHERTLEQLAPLFLGFEKKSTTSLASRLKRWFGDGDKAWIFDNATDTLSLGNIINGFDTTTILDDVTARTPWLMYVFHRINESLNGVDKVIIMLDEGWKLLDDPAFALRIKDWEKTIRKQNGLLGFATQSVGDIFKSEVGEAIVEQSPTNIFMPNPRADYKTYCEGFGLSKYELSLIKEQMTPESRFFLIRHGTETVIARLNLNNMDSYIAVLSGRTETVNLCEELRATHGDNPDDWLPHFLEALNYESPFPANHNSLERKAS